jgi:hypothetical protein
MCLLLNMAEHINFEILIMFRVAKLLTLLNYSVTVE